MAEQQSKRANTVTSAAFDAPFETQTLRFGQGGLNLKDSLDAMEGWSRMTNIWHESEGEATTRPGQKALVTFPANSYVHSIRKLRDIGSGGKTRFWGVDTSLYMGLAGDAPINVGGGFSGKPLALLPARPTLSSTTWMFVGDSAKMVKVRGDHIVMPIGLPAPATPTTAMGTEYSYSIANFSSIAGEGDGTGFSSWTPVAGTDGEGNPVGVPQQPIPTEGPIDGRTGTAIYCQTNPGNPQKGYDSWWGCAVSRNARLLNEVGGSGTRPSNDNDIVHVWLKLANPESVAEIRLYIVVSPVFDAQVLPGTQAGGGPNAEAYVKAFRPNDYVQFVHAREAQIEAAEQARIYALRDKDSEQRGYNDTRPTWEVERAGADPGRARSFQLGLGEHEWVGYGQVGSALRRGDFQRIGSDKTRNWETITGLVLYIRTTEGAGITSIGIDDLYITGGFGPDTVEPGMQMYDYRVTHYDPRTGAESNGSPEQPTTAYRDAIRRHITVDPAGYGDAAIRQRIYRRGGSLIDDWYYCGQNTSDGGVFEDTLSDADLAAAPTLPVDHYQPVPTIDSAGNTILAQPLPCLWGPIEGMIMGCGDVNRAGHVYYSNPDAPDHWSATGNVEVCAASEELMNGCLLGHQAFVWSRLRGYFLYPNLGGPMAVTASPSLCTRGLLARWAFCTGPGGVAYFVAEDGIFATQGGPEEWLSEAINPLFYGTEVNGYKPIDKVNFPTALRLTVWENCLYFQYPDTDGVMHVLVYSILQKFWRPYTFGRWPCCLQGEDEEVLLVGGMGTGKAYTHGEPTGNYDDDGLPIDCVIRTGSASGQRREEKLFGDIFLDADVAGHTLQLQVFLNEEVFKNKVIELKPQATARQRYIISAFGNNPQRAHSIACQLSWSSTGPPPTLYQLGVSMTLQPDLTNGRVTNWDDLGSPDECYVTGVTLDCDTAGLGKTIAVERDFGGQRSEITRINVISSNRHKVKFSWPAVAAHMVRLRPDPNDCVPWMLYRADWIYQQEPPRIAKWDIHFESEWDQYYTGLDLYCDTNGREKRVAVFVDSVRLLHPHTQLPYWTIKTDGRQVVHLTLPWGRGHVFHFVAVDENPGLLYTHRWHLQPEPSEQANWNQNFSLLGTRADKWLKAIVFECDTFGQDKSVQVEVDGAVVETLTVNTTGRRVVQLALPEQHLGRVWRIFPVDEHPGRLYSAEPIFDEEPFALDRWETQETNHGFPGWFYPLYAHITLKSTEDVTLTTYVQHNQVGDVTKHEYTIPSTDGQKQRRFLNGFRAVKGVLIKYVLQSDAPFWLYRDETTVVIQPWGAARAVTVQPFGNDDLDPSRPMTHAVLAAQASGGGPPS